MHQTPTFSLLLYSREKKALGRNYTNTFIWKPALKRAGVPMTRENGSHALRHFYASTALHEGESIKALSEYLGHADPGFTLRTYTHLVEDSAERTKRAVDAVFGHRTTEADLDDAPPDDERPGPTPLFHPDDATAQDPTAIHKVAGSSSEHREPRTSRP